MKIGMAATALSAVLAALLGCSTPAKTSSPRFTHMDMALATGDRAKGADTRVEFSIVPAGGGRPVAYLDVTGAALAPYSIVRETVPTAGDGFAMDDLKHEQIAVKITPAGYGTWTCGFDVILHFDDGSQALLGSGNLVLSNGRTEAFVPLSEATVASASAIGGVEKFAFRLLSKGSLASAGGSANGSKNPRSNSKEFTHMDVALATGNRGKDADTRLEFIIAPRDGDPAAAYLDVQGQALTPDTTVAEVVPASGTSFTLADLKHEQIFVRITPGSGSTWSFRFDAILHFADGTEALWSTGKFSLSGSNRLAAIPLSDTTLARPTMIGGVERFAFRLMSKVSATEAAPPPPSAHAQESAQASGSAPAPSPPRLSRRASTRDFTQMDVNVKTRNRGKDPDTRLEISIVPRDGGSPVAYLDVQGQPLYANSKVLEVVPAVGTGFTLDDLKHEQILVKITPAVRSTWTHGFDLVLHFADGTDALWSTGNLVLTDDSNQEFIPLSDATIASHSVLGGLEKFGYGVLNKIGK